MGRECRSQALRLRHLFNASDEGDQDLQEEGNFRAIQTLLGHTKLESTVRYLKVEMEDARNKAEQIEL
jgi:hypothetical protein